VVCDDLEVVQSKGASSLVALEKRASLDAMVIARLHKEWDELL